MSLALGSELVLLLEWQWLIRVHALANAVSVNIIVHQLKMIHSEKAMSNKSPTVHAKRLLAVQLGLQWFNQLTGGEKQYNVKA